MSKNTNINTAAANNTTKEMSTMSKTAIARVAAATPVTAISNGFLMAGEVTSKLAHFIAGEENWSKVPGHGYNDARVTGAVMSINTSDALARAKAKMAEKADHSDMVEWKKGKWVPSVKATEQAKANGHEQAFLPHMYKAANWIIRVAKEGGDKVYSSTQGEIHSYLGWTFKTIFRHADYMEGKGVKNAKSPEKLAEYFSQACKHSKVEADKLPTWEQVCAAVQAEQAMVKAEEATDDYQCEPGYAEETAEEARDGRAPKTTPAYDIKALVRKAGVTRLKADNAFEVAEKAKAAFEAKKLTNDEFQFVVEACIAKDGGDPEEFYALMGEN